jgi:hypothetical protein
MASSSKKTYTINITYTTKSPNSEFDYPKNSPKYNSSNYGMDSSFSKPVSNWQSNSGMKSLPRLRLVLYNVQSILRHA